jgi:hypothetical protein
MLYRDDIQPVCTDLYDGAIQYRYKDMDPNPDNTFCPVVTSDIPLEYSMRFVGASSNMGNLFRIIIIQTTVTPDIQYNALTIRIDIRWLPATE